MTEELQQAMEGDRRAIARMLSKIENGSISLADISLERSSIESEAWSKDWNNSNKSTFRICNCHGVLVAHPGGHQDRPRAHVCSLVLTVCLPNT